MTSPRSTRALLLVVLALAMTPAASTVNPASVVDRSDARVEDVVVTGEPMKRGKPPEFEFLMHLYDSRRKGTQLYRERRYDEAFPLLLHAAKRGFKMAQGARLLPLREWPRNAP